MHSTSMGKEEDQGDEEGVMAMDMVEGEEDQVNKENLLEEEVQDRELEDEEELERSRTWSTKSLSFVYGKALFIIIICM